MSWVIKITENPMVPAYYIMAACIIGILTMFLCEGNTGKALRGSAPAVEEKQEVVEFIF